jgi:hypothetical protein
VLLGLRYCSPATDDNRDLLRVAMGWTCSSRLQTGRNYGCYLKKRYHSTQIQRRASDNIKIVFDETIVNIWPAVTWARYAGCH